MYRLLALVLLAVVTHGLDISQLCKTISGSTGSQFVRSPNNCSEFFNCKGPVSRHAKLSCGNNSVFSQAFQVCVYRKSTYDDCNQEIYAGKVRDSVCRRGTGMNQDPKDCQRFVPCYEHMAYPSMPCQEGLHFSFNRQQCMTPEQAKCHINKR